MVCLGGGAPGRLSGQDLRWAISDIDAQAQLHAHSSDGYPHPDVAAHGYPHPDVAAHGYPHTNFRTRSHSDATTLRYANGNTSTLSHTQRHARAYRDGYVLSNGDGNRCSDLHGDRDPRTGTHRHRGADGHSRAANRYSGAHSHPRAAGSHADLQSAGDHEPGSRRGVGHQRGRGNQVLLLPRQQLLAELGAGESHLVPDGG
jgi:hypothetical protein